MTSATARPRRSRRPAGLLLLSLAGASLAACATFVEIPVETPLQSKIDVSAFRRVLVAGFVTDLSDTDVELAPETTRLLQNQLRSNTKLQVLEPDRPPLNDALEKSLEKLGEGGKYTKQEREQYRLEADRVLQDGEFWRKVGEEYQNPLIVTGRVGFDAQNRSGFQSEERVVRDPGTSRPRLVRANRYLERKGFSLSAEFYFIDGRTGATMYSESYREEILYNAQQNTPALSSYFELMDRLVPNFLSALSSQKIRGTRVLLK